MADLAAARKEAEEALAAWDCDASRISPSPRHSLAVDCVMALRSLLAATEPAPALPDEVREAAEAFRRVNKAQRDDSCTDAGCIVCKRREDGDRLLAALAAHGGRS